MSPQRIQRQRTKGWRMPEGAIYVSRPSRWGNPFKVGDDAEVRLGPAIGDPPSNRRPEVLDITACTLWPCDLLSEGEIVVMVSHHDMHGEAPWIEAAIAPAQQYELSRRCDPETLQPLGESPPMTHRFYRPDDPLRVIRLVPK